MTDVLQLQQISKKYAKQHVLKNISLSVQQGEFLALIGVNGAGKTTLIKTILDFEEADTGQITIFEQSHLKPQSRQTLAFLPEQFKPPIFLTGLQFLKYIAKLHQIPIKLDDIKKLCSQLDLDSEVLHKPIKKYSKGMNQKLGLVSCFFTQKPLLILDEPMSGLDPKARAYFKHYLQNLKQQQQTVFFTTHLLFDIQTLCDRMAILHDGELRFIGTPQQCCAQYQTDDLEQAYLRCIGADCISG
ncbi:ABC transporter ATP-binding protein [Candidatus Albibeggiatoa sp. nov. NOAA]|uniref:ABC transporter ATP-binding protein n=1 Tax=Candidatus Albibeggiatoa sp. nov. NOAA TaxID=3162724 RepID=UPI0032FD0FBA|nr:ABC transporter ATP-binding protein [Thiotrichaceae bacterium]